MPSVIVHFALLDKVRESADQQSKSILIDYPKEAYWGSIGPDYLFFSPSDWDAIGPLFEFIYKLQNDLKEVIEFHRKIQDFKGDAKDFVTGGLHSELERTVEYLNTTVITHLAAAVSEQVDLFKFVESPAQRYEPIGNWWWMDVLHSVRTTDYCRNLWKNAKGDRSAISYAMGYFTHVAGDVVVHPYINFIAGGPYRLQPRRHVLIEKVFDSYVLKTWYRGRQEHIATCDWHKKINFSGQSSYPDLPGNILRLKQKSLADTYSDLGIKSGVPNENDINLMYRFFYQWMEGVTSHGIINLGPPPRFKVVDLPPELLRLITEPPKFPTGIPRDEADWAALLKALFGLVSWAVKILVGIAALTYTVIAQLAAAPFKYFLWLLQKLLYTVYLNARIILSLGGYIHPGHEHFDYFQDIINPNLDLLREFNKYPYNSPNKTKKQSYHLVHPATTGVGNEDPSTTPFSLYAGKLSGFKASDTFKNVKTVLLGDGVSGLKEDYLSICQLNDANDIHRHVASKHAFVSARTLSHLLFREFQKTGGIGVPNFNLDSDRGFVWPVWEHHKDPPWTDASDFSFKCS
jgi:hypothetical protein